MTEYPLGVYDGGMKAFIKRRSLHRAKIVRGQLDNLIEMIECEEYCVDIMTQSLAIQRALRSLNKLILENHMQTHLADAFRTGDKAQQDQALAELVKLYELHNVRGR